MTKDQVSVAGQPADVDGLDTPTAAAVYDNHLALAAYLESWAGSLRAEVGSDARPPIDERDFLLGYLRALVDLAGQLRVGDGLEGGPLLGGA